MMTTMLPLRLLMTFLPDGGACPAGQDARRHRSGRRCAAGWPEAPTKRRHASTLGPIDRPGTSWPTGVGVDGVDWPRARRAVAADDGRHVGEHEQAVGARARSPVRPRSGPCRRRLPRRQFAGVRCGPRGRRRLRRRPRARRRRPGSAMSRSPPAPVAWVRPPRAASGGPSAAMVQPGAPPAPAPHPRRSRARRTCSGGRTLGRTSRRPLWLRTQAPAGPPPRYTAPGPASSRSCPGSGRRARRAGTAGQVRVGWALQREHPHLRPVAVQSTSW